MILIQKLLKVSTMVFILTDNLISHCNAYNIIRLDKVIKEKLIFFALVYYY